MERYDLNFLCDKSEYSKNKLIRSKVLSKVDVTFIFFEARDKSFAFYIDIGGANRQGLSPGENKRQELKSSEQHSQA
jgi:hypothetical protein